MKKESACQVKENSDGIFFLKKNFHTEMKPRFLAKNQENNELFLLFENFDKFFVFKGKKSEGLHLCESMYPMMLPPYSIGFVFEDAGLLYLIVHSEFETSQEITLIYDGTLKEDKLKIVPFDFFK
jgi:hypothetical protein